jgi:hypothetical protein
MYQTMLVYTGKNLIRRNNCDSRCLNEMHGIVGGANEFLLHKMDTTLNQFLIAFSVAMHGNTVAVISWKFCPHIRELYFIKISSYLNYIQTQ